MKRFTETTKWDDPWFRKLPPKLKCLWQYIVDRCDGAGVIDLDCELAGFQIGAKITDQDIAGLGDRIERLECGKLWVVRFVAFQYGKLSEECKAHAPVLSSLSAYGLTERVSKGYSKGIHTLQEKEKEKEGVKDNPSESPKRKDRGTLTEVQGFCISVGLPPSDGEASFHKWEGNGWKNGGEPVRDWRATIRSWKAAGYMPSQKANGKRPALTAEDRARRLGPTPVEQAAEDFFKS